MAENHRHRKLVSLFPIPMHRQPKIENLHEAILIDQQVLRFDVPVNKSRQVNLMQTQCRLSRDITGLFRRESIFFAQPE